MNWLDKWKYDSQFSGLQTKLVQYSLNLPDFQTVMLLHPEMTAIRNLVQHIAHFLNVLPMLHLIPNIIESASRVKDAK